MQEKDIILKDYESDNVHFCDFVNGALAGGEPLLCPEKLEAMPTEVLKILEVNKVKTVHRFRDLTKKYKTEDGSIIIAIQNQNDVDFGMPLRVMLEDALEYDMQRRLFRKGRIHKKDRLMEVITIIFYHGSAPWSGPTDLSELIRVPKELKRLDEYKQSYPIILITPDTADTSCFGGEWKEILEILKRQNNEAEMKRYLAENAEKYQALSEDTNRLIFALLGHLEEYKKLIERGERASMCKAFEDHYQSGVKKGEREGAIKTEKRMQKLISAMVQAGDAALLPKLGEDESILAAMYQKYNI